VAQLCQVQQEILDLNTEVLIISFNVPAFAQRWLEETGRCFQLLLDPGRVVYDAYGLERSISRSWNLGTVVRYLELMRDGHRWHGIQGDSTQLGGDFIVDSNGILRLAHRSQDPTDRPPVSRILSTLGQLDKE
jgi:peroxiredoxin